MSRDRHIPVVGYPELCYSPTLFILSFLVDFLVTLPCWLCILHQCHVEFGYRCFKLLYELLDGRGYRGGVFSVSTLSRILAVSFQLHGVQQTVASGFAVNGSWIFGIAITLGWV